MSTPRFDAVVVGAGIVGSACALALCQAGLDVALVEAHPPPRWQRAVRDLRVVAFAPDNVALFKSLGVWEEVASSRVQAYRRMRVWDVAGGGALEFDADALGRRELGYIVENNLLADTLWRAVQRAGVALHCPARVEAFSQTANSTRLTLETGEMLEARICIAADGAASTLRGLAGVAVKAHDYQQRGIVAYVQGTLRDEACAFQRFLPGGPLALLPAGEGLHSIVWSLPEMQAQRLLDAPEAQFAAELTRASDRVLGELTLASERAAFPLRRQLVATQCEGRLLLLGDAAHVVHPLAGQGVNLGLRDVAALQNTVQAAMQKSLPFDAPARLARWARERRSDNTISAYAFEAINRGWAATAPFNLLARRPLLGLANRMAPLKRALWGHAAGG